MAFQNVISISGGKDSTAMLLLALERGMPNLVPVFADTGNEHPQTYEYVAYLEQSLDIEIQRVKADFRGDFARKRQYIADHWPDDLKERGMQALEETTGIPFLDLAMLKGRFPSTNIESRAELDSNYRARQTFRVIRNRFNHWRARNKS